MNKADLVAAMAEKAGVSKKDAEASLKAFTDVVAEELKKGEKIQPIFMACGSEDFLLNENHEFRDFLLKNKVDVTYKESTGIHEWKFWNEYLEPAIEWLLESDK